MKLSQEDWLENTANINNMNVSRIVKLGLYETHYGLEVLVVSRGIAVELVLNSVGEKKLNRKNTSNLGHTHF